MLLYPAPSRGEIESYTSILAHEFIKRLLPLASIQRGLFSRQIFPLVPRKPPVLIDVGHDAKLTGDTRRPMPY